MKNKIAITTVLISAILFVVFSYVYSINEHTTGYANNTIEHANIQGSIGIILLLFLVISAFFIFGNINLKLKKNFHKKP